MDSVNIVAFITISFAVLIFIIIFVTIIQASKKLHKTTQIVANKVKEKIINENTFKEDSINRCEYCGSTNKQGLTQCEHCGANLKNRR